MIQRLTILRSLEIRAQFSANGAEEKTSCAFVFYQNVLSKDFPLNL
jgi:hypothetical protein